MGIGPMELVLILIIVVLVFGVGKLPEVGSKLGEGIRNFKKALSHTEMAHTEMAHTEMAHTEMADSKNLDATSSIQTQKDS